MKPRNGKYTARVHFGGVLLVCEGNYYRGFDGDRTDPPEPETFEFYSVKHMGECVYSLLGAEKLTELEQACIADLKERE
jgi:hypothetical protein